MQKEDPKIAVEVLIGHGECNIIIECDNDLTLSKDAVQQIVNRISESEPKLNLKVVSQDVHLAANQNDVLKCGDNGIFKGMPVTDEQETLTSIAYDIYEKYNSDGKYIIDEDKLIICQSKAGKELNEEYVDAKVNPLGYWTGGIDVDSGATNRKLLPLIIGDVDDLLGNDIILGIDEFYTNLALLAIDEMQTAIYGEIVLHILLQAHAEEATVLKTSLLLTCACALKCHHNDDDSILSQTLSVTEHNISYISYTESIDHDIAHMHSACHLGTVLIDFEHIS